MRAASFVAHNHGPSYALPLAHRPRCHLSHSTVNTPSGKPENPTGLGTELEVVADLDEVLRGWQAGQQLRLLQLGRLLDEDYGAVQTLYNPVASGQRGREGQARDALYCCLLCASAVNVSLSPAS